MPDRSNVDVVEKIQNAWRSAAGASQQGYSCWICGERHTTGWKLWTHAKLAHPGHPDINLEDEAEAKRQFLDRSYVPNVILL